MASSSTSFEAVCEFLKAFFEYADEVNLILVHNSEENRECLAHLGINHQQRIDILRTLTAEHFCQGPITEEGRTAKAWVFGLVVDGHEIYIKLSLDKRCAPMCWSFHIAKYPMTYPFKPKVRR